MQNEQRTLVIAISHHVGVENDVHGWLRRMQERVAGERRYRQRGKKEKLFDWVHGLVGKAGFKSECLCFVTGEWETGDWM